MYMYANEESHGQKENSYASPRLQRDGRVVKKYTSQI
jgi:hypothetical protein